MQVSHLCAVSLVHAGTLLLNRAEHWGESSLESKHIPFKKGCQDGAVDNSIFLMITCLLETDLKTAHSGSHRVVDLFPIICPAC